MDNEDAQKLDSLKARDADTATVVEWLRRNQNRFRKPVIEPAALSVSVKRREFVDAIEAGFNMAQLKVCFKVMVISFQTLAHARF